MMTITTARCLVRTPRTPRTPRSMMLDDGVSSPVAWFAVDGETGEATEHADVWTDHHRIAHERHPTREDMTWCGRRTLGSDAPSYARIFAVGCHACAAARAQAP
jgi:hypothetical protein